MAQAIIAGLSKRRRGFAPGPIHVGFVVDEVAVGQVFSEFFDFPLSVYHSTVALHTHINWKINNMSASGSSSEM
jgi:hypothetical protein